jgi:hypothetical protein
MAVNANKILSGGLPVSKTAEISTARTGVDNIASPSDGADLRELFTAGANGGFYDLIEYQVVGTGTQAAFIIYLWETDTSGANAKIFKAITVAAGSAMSNTVIGQKGVFVPVDANLSPGIKIFVSQSVVSANCKTNYTLRGGQFEAQ